MNRDYYEIAEIKQLELAFLDRHTGELLAKHFEKLVKRGNSELALMKALRRDLDRLPPGPERQTIAARIQEYTAGHTRLIKHYADILVHSDITT